MKPLIIGITGGSGSGKTTLVRHLKDRFIPAQICFISQDDYYHPRETQRIDEKGIKNFDLPESINKKAFVKDVKKMIEGETVTRMEYVFNNELATPKKLHLNQPAHFLVEGIFVFHFKKMRKLLDLKIFVHAKENLKVIRRIKRDQIRAELPPR